MIIDIPYNICINRDRSTKSYLYEVIFSQRGTIGVGIGSVTGVGGTKGVKSLISSASPAASIS